MSRNVISLFLLLSVSTSASAHFVFVVPDAGGSTARVILSETLAPDNDVDIAMIQGAKLSMKTAGGEEPLQLQKAPHAFIVPLPGTGEKEGGMRLIHGVVNLGVTTFGGAPNLLTYYPKTIAGDAFAAKTTLGKEVPVELVPEGKEGAVKLKLLVDGKARPDAEITVLMPDGTQEKAQTDAQGETQTFTERGRYGAWARDFEPAPGGESERDGKKFKEIHNYATLVFDAGVAPGAAPSSAATRQAITATPYATLPQAVASFGAVATGGWLYIYGGHIAPTHSYSTTAVSGEFHRLNLSDGKTWETLPSGPPMQGMNLAAYHGKIYRVGGMQPHNKPGEDEDVRSSAECACYDPATAQWTALPPLPSGRSSYDMAVIGDTLFVTGGWDLKGPDGPEWTDNMLTMDLSAAHPAWKTLPEPFRRRALIAAAYHGRLYAIGGFDENSETVMHVDIYDPATRQWSRGPDLPGDERNAFGPAACVLDNHLYVSVADGSLYQLSDAGNAWLKAGSATPRIVHRLAAVDGAVLVIGGAAHGANSNLVEKVIPTIAQ